MEWIDGIKLTDETALKKACLNRRELIDQVLRAANVTSLRWQVLMFSYLLEKTGH